MNKRFFNLSHVQPAELRRRMGRTILFLASHGLSPNEHWAAVLRPERFKVVETPDGLKLKAVVETVKKIPQRKLC
jgi:hypothetical protein